MSKISATDFIKKFNPENISGTVKPSLDMLQNLKKSNGLVSAFQAVGHDNLLKTLQDILGRIKQDEKDALVQVHGLITKVQDSLKNV